MQYIPPPSASAVATSAAAGVSVAANTREQVIREERLQERI